MIRKKNWYWQQNIDKHIIIISTHTILHPCIDVSIIKYIDNTPRSIYEIIIHLQATQRHPVCIYDVYHDYIFDEIMRRDYIEDKRQIRYGEN